MRILASSGMMSCNSLCSRVMCCIKVGFLNTSQSLLTKHFKSISSSGVSVVCNIPKQIHSSSQLCNDESIEETADSEEMSFSLTRSIIIEDYSEHFRNTLYPDSNDPIMLQLKTCDSIRRVLTIMNENVRSLTSDHYCQIVLVLWDIWNKGNLQHNGPNVVSLSKSVESDVPQSLTAVLSDILNVLVNDVERLNSEELVCGVLYATRLGISLKHPSIQTFLMRIDNLLTSQDADCFPISALSRLTIAFNNHSELWTKIFLIKTIPLIYTHFDRCQTSEDFRALTISMLSTIPYLREELLVEYEALTEEFLRKGVLTRSHSSVIVKAVMLLNNIYYIPAARYMIYKLLHLLHGDLNNLFPPHLIDIKKVVSHQVEPHYTIVELESLKKIVLPTSTRDLAFSVMYLPMLSFSTDSKGLSFLKEIITSCDKLDSLMNVQYHLTAARVDVCNLFWSRVAQILESAQPLDVQTLQRVCLRYLHFSARMISYRHRQFECTILSLISAELVRGTAVLQPRLLAVLSTFVLMFDQQHGTSSLSCNIAPRLLNMMGQFDALCCLWISRGLGERIKRSKDLHILLQVDSAMNDRTREIMESADPSSIETLNLILRSCINRKQSMESDLMQDVVSRWSELNWTQLTSRSLRNLMYNLHIMSILIPSVVDNLAEYCVSNNMYVVGDTVGKLLHMCYCLGYTPRHLDSLCAITADLAIRDGGMLNGLSLLQIALALSYFNRLQPSLIRRIFTVDFLETLDNEIKHCFAKDRYPLRVRQTLMELNRSVCLDQPEADVPWFHSKFCDEQKSLGQLETVPKSVFFTDVYGTLLSLVGDPKHIGTRTFTPYGYVLDMQLNLDVSLNPVPIKNTESVAHKLALLLHHGDSYTTFEQRLKGFHQMKQRHLEIMGYRVIGLSDCLWNAMFMMEPKAKQEYLRSLIWSS